MKRLLPSQVSFGVVSPDGAYKVTAVFNKAPVSIGTVSSGSSFKTSIDESNRFLFGVVDNLGASFTGNSYVISDARLLVVPAELTEAEFYSPAFSFPKLPSQATVAFEDTHSSHLSSITYTYFSRSSMPVADTLNLVGSAAQPLPRVRSAFYISYTEIISSSFGLTYYSPTRLVKEVVLDRSLLYPIIYTLDVVFPFRLVARISTPPYAIIKPLFVSKAFSAASYSIVRDRVVKEFILSDNYARVQASFDIPTPNYRTLVKAQDFTYSLLSSAQKSFDVTYNSYDRFGLSFDFNYAIKDTDTLVKSFPVSYMSLRELETVINQPTTGTVTTPDGQTYVVSNSGTHLAQTGSVDIISVEPVILVDGGYVYVESMTISIDEGNYAYTLEAVLASYADFQKFPANKLFYASLQGELYHFIVDSKSIDRQEVNAPKANIRGLSPATMLTGARSKQIIGITYDLPLTAKSIALDLLTNRYLLTYTTPTDPDPWYTQDESTVKWEILDWGIPPYRFGVENQYPLDSVKLLAEVVGGVVESYPNGDLRVRYKHPVAVTDYSDAVVDHEFIDTEDLLSLQERHSPTKKVNSIYIKTYQDIGVQDRIEFFDTLNGTPRANLPGETLGAEFGGYIRVFPSVWRDAVILNHSKEGNPDIKLIYLGIEEWYPYAWMHPDYGWETVEIKQSQGNARYPIYTVEDHFYYDKDCGTPIVQDYSTTFYTPNQLDRYGLIRMKYKTRCHTWQLKCPGGTRIQFVVKDNVFNSYLR